MKKTLLICLCALTSTAYGQWSKPMSCLVEGNMSGTSAKEVYLLPYDKDIRFDGGEIQLNNGRFKTELQIDTLVCYQLLLPHELGFYFVNFFPEAEGVRISYDAQQDQLAAHSTGPNNLDMERYYKARIKLFKPRLDSINARRERLLRQGGLYTKEVTVLKEQWDSTNNSSILDSLSKLIGELNRTGRYFTKEGQALEAEDGRISREREQWTHEYIAQNPNLANFYLLLSNTENAIQRKKEVASLLEIYDRHYAGLFAGHPFHATMESYRQHQKMVVGAKYIDTTLPDSQGRETKLSEVAGGKIALLDMWASWCASCRRHSISVIPIYEKYKDKGFTVVGVAREYKDDKAWREALARDGYPWTNLLEIDSRNNLWNRYGVTGSAGASFLLDRDGTILAVDPTAEQIEAILEKKL